MFKRIATSLAFLAITVAAASAQTPEFEYTLKVDAADTTGFDVVMRIRNAPATFTLAAAAHPEYDDKYWRYLTDMRASSNGLPLAVTRVDSVLWRVRGARNGNAVVQYRIKLPAAPTPRAAWRPYLTATGGLVGGPHSFLYVLGREHRPARVTLELPAGWQAASGLSQSADARILNAPNIHVLMESPMQVGVMRNWRFAVDGVPHRIAYWPLPNATPFDSTAFVSAVERLVRETIKFWGSIPYRDYTFIFQDGAFSGGLEHPNSVTLGALSSDLARDPQFTIEEIAHEFVHTWNLMFIKPAEYRGVEYTVQPPVTSLWFSEGLTIFYADLLRRRAGLSTDDSTRVAHLERLISRYVANPGNARFSAERVSQVAYNAGPEALGDYSVGTHLQGEVIGAMLDFIVRDATDGRRSMDDVMRLLLTRFGGKRGFVGTDIERAVTDVCSCDVHSFFEAHVRGAGKAIDFNRYLEPLGLRTTPKMVPVVNREGRPELDFRIRAYERPGTGSLTLLVLNPESVWGRAGLHTGDQLVSVNGSKVRTWPEFRTVLTRFQMGDTARVVVARPNGDYATTLRFSNWEWPSATVALVADASERQRRLRAAWMAGK